MRQLPKHAIARLRTAAGKVVGAGFLADPTHVLTCAHVAAQGLGALEMVAEAPKGLIVLDFPLLEGSKPVEATVASWFPVVVGPGNSRPKGSTSQIADVAVLEIVGDSPAGTTAPTFAHLTEYWGRKFRAFGFPPGFDQGVWASGLLVDEQAGGWVQIEDVKSTGYFVAPGFSGTLVWDVDAGGVVGMVVGADARPEIRAAFMIPMPILIEAWPPLKDVVAARHARRFGDVGEVSANVVTGESLSAERAADRSLLQDFQSGLPPHIMSELKKGHEGQIPIIVLPELEDFRKRWNDEDHWFKDPKLEALRAKLWEATDRLLGSVEGSKGEHVPMAVRPRAKNRERCNQAVREVDKSKGEIVRLHESLLREGRARLGLTESH